MHAQSGRLLSGVEARIEKKNKFERKKKMEKNQIKHTPNKLEDFKQ